MVVDGRAEFVGSNAGEVKTAIQKAAARPKAGVVLSRGAGGLIINIDQIPSKDDADVYLAITESGLRSNVTADENSGRKLDHTACRQSCSYKTHVRGRSSVRHRCLSNWRLLRHPPA